MPFSPVANAQSVTLVGLMHKAALGNPRDDPLGWARRCRIEAVRAIHPSTKSFLIELAMEFEAVAGATTNIDPDDADLQGALADRLAELVARDGRPAR